MSQSVLDESVWEEMYKLQEETAPDLIAGLIEQFCGQVPESIAKMKSGLIKGDANALAMEAHKLKSSCAYLGAFGMRNICLRLEKLTRPENAAEAALAVGQLEAEYGPVKACLVKRAVA